MSIEEFFTELDDQNLLDDNYKFQKIKKIKDYIAKLPDQKVLKDLCKTEDLLFLWFKMRCFYGQIARCFSILYLAENQESYNIELTSVFKEALEQNWIKKKDKEFYELEAKRILKEWNLIEVGFPYLIAEMPNLHFHEDTALFFNLLSNEATEQIQQHTKSYYEINIHERSKIYERIYEAARGETHIKNKLLKSPIFYRYKLKEEIIKLLSSKAQADQDIERRLKELQIADNDFDLLAVDICKNRNSKGKWLKSEVWKNGERYLLKKDGLEKYPLMEELKLHFSESSLQETKLVLQQFIDGN
ncbi:hypothetical protein NIES2107_56160 [Nostoc carneum NIES-2107]|nr:hypothetical protein NIES2107_56160 [Nostoc carneum NIES-2107]